MKLLMTFLVCFSLLGGVAYPASSDFAIRLTWNDNSDNENFFYVWRWQQRGRGNWYWMIQAVPSNQTIYTDTDTRRGNTYCYVITAINDVGQSSDSNEACVTL
jgi:fibronectin type 3 domain-containing protein